MRVCVCMCVYVHEKSLRPEKDENFNADFQSRHIFLARKINATLSSLPSFHIRR